MTIDVPSDYEDILLRAVASGAFASPEDALRRALELFAAEQPPTDPSKTTPSADEVSKRERWNERNQISIEQSEQGLSKPLNNAEVIGRLKSRLAENESRH